MATPAMAYGERRFGAAYTARIFVVLVAAGLLIGLWAAPQNDPRTSSHPALMWVSIGLVFAVAALWVVLGKSALIINDSGVRRESVLGQQEIARLDVRVGDTVMDGSVRRRLSTLKSRMLGRA